MQPRADRTYCASQSLGRIRVAKFFQIAKDRYGPIAFRKRQDGFAERLQIALPAETITRVLSSDLVFPYIGPYIWPPIIAHLTAHLISRHPNQKGFQGAPFRVVLDARVEQRQEHLLHDFFCRFVIPGHMQCESKYGAITASVERQKSLFITGLAIAQQLVVASIFQNCRPLQRSRRLS